MKDWLTMLASVAWVWHEWSLTISSGGIIICVLEEYSNETIESLSLDIAGRTFCQGSGTSFGNGGCTRGSVLCLGRRGSD
jgi:hypothetical protein